MEFKPIEINGFRLEKLCMVFHCDAPANAGENNLDDFTAV